VSEGIVGKPKKFSANAPGRKKKGCSVGPGGRGGENRGEPREGGPAQREKEKT